MLNPYELVYMYRMGDEYALKMMIRYLMPVIRNAIAESLGRDEQLMIFREDMYEDSILAILNALESYREDRDASFWTYSKVAIQHAVMGVNRYQNRLKRCGGHTAVSLDAAVMERSEVIDFLASKDRLSDPVYVLHMKEAKKKYDRAVETLTEREREVLEAWVSGRDDETARNELNLTRKAYETRKYRIRKKVMRKVLEDE